MAHQAQSFAGLDLDYYDSILGPAQLDAIAAELLQGFPREPGGDVLELACGTGIATRKLREALAPQVRLVATDLSPAMVDYARKKLHDRAIEWREADIAHLPFPDASFAAVACCLGIMFVPEKGKAFAEVRRVLREGGVFFFNTWSGLQANPHAQIAAAVMDEMFPGDAEMQFTKIPMGFFDPQVIRGHLVENRLRDVRIERRPIPIRCESAHRYATGMVKGTPRALLIRERGRSVDEVVDRIAAAFARAGGEAPFAMTANVTVVEARAV